MERVVAKAIKNDIAIYAIHTALDNLNKGVSHSLADALGLSDIKIMIPQAEHFKTIDCVCPQEKMLIPSWKSSMRPVQELWAITTNVALLPLEKDHSEEMKIPNPTWASQ